MTRLAANLRFDQRVESAARPVSLGKRSLSYGLATFTG